MRKPAPDRVAGSHSRVAGNRRIEETVGARQKGSLVTITVARPRPVTPTPTQTPTQTNPPPTETPTETPTTEPTASDTGAAGPDDSASSLDAAPDFDDNPGLSAEPTP
jgi:cell division septation protein DedD